ncbi:hypothetical protein RIF29_40284 [Crotalaria pallida]|uniref:Uncharacterized protein n=1 Tax=Crotalaria pallida TaxID=3830 RepID=A0AAN9E5V9_CROPI
MMAEFVFSAENCTATPPQASVVATPTAGAKGDQNKEGLVRESEENQEIVKIPDNQGVVNADEIQGTNNVSADQEEALHGDWLIVRRKKRSGFDRKKGMKVDRDKNISTQSYFAEENKHVELQKNEKSIMGSPHLLTFPSTVMSLFNTGSRGKGHDNGKKRARKESQHVAQKKDIVERISVIDKGPTMHVSESTNVQTSAVLRNERVNSPSQLTNLKSYNKDSEDLTRAKNKNKVMKGFDLGTEITISPDLLGGRMLHGSKGGKPNGKPPDPDALNKQLSSRRKEVNIEEDTGRCQERGGMETSGMILDSGQ